MNSNSGNFMVDLFPEGIEYEYPEPKEEEEDDDKEEL